MTNVWQWTTIVPTYITECCLWAESSIQKSQYVLTPEVSDNYNKNHTSQYHHYGNYTTSYSFMMVKFPCFHVSTDGKCFSIMSLPACSNNNYFCAKALNMKTMWLMLWCSMILSYLGTRHRCQVVHWLYHTKECVQILKMWCRKFLKTYFCKVLFCWCLRLSFRGRALIMMACKVVI